MSAIVEKNNQKLKSYTHDIYGNEYKVPLEQLPVEELEEILQKMNHVNAELHRLSEKHGWGI